MKKGTALKQLAIYIGSASIAAVLAIGTSAAFADVNPTDIPANTGAIAPTFNGLNLTGGITSNQAIEVSPGISVNQLRINNEGANSVFGDAEVAPNGSTTFENFIHGFTAIDDTLFIGRGIGDAISLGNNRIVGGQGSSVDVDRIDADELTVLRNIDANGSITANSIGATTVRKQGPRPVNSKTVLSNMVASCNAGEVLMSCGFETYSDVLASTRSNGVMQENSHLSPLANPTRCEITAYNMDGVVKYLRPYAVCFSPQG